ncbi:hypothetical protein ASA1KI_41510 [Opitutales bacterium ASA1]|uniref:glycoside hydrolase family 52 protein n=1 Tax=Congregicoccus parvus TaxID=3081749 RepID=UPI002B2D1C5A|nr:hypothetical protein ASA1KI_41510 [Opitutales bacterium ASA1]
MRHDRAVRHAAFGADCGFELGAEGKAGGFTRDGVPVPPQSVFTGYRYPDEPWTILPFATSEHLAGLDGPGWRPLPAARYGRSVGWGTDRWMAQALVFSLSRPMPRGLRPGVLPEGADVQALAPVLYSILDYDNAHTDDPVELVFAITQPGAAWEQATVPAGPGVAGENNAAAWTTTTGFGFAVVPPPAGAAWTFEPRRLGGGGDAAGFVFRVPAGGRAVVKLVLGAHTCSTPTGAASVRAEGGAPCYTRAFPTLETVLGAGLESFDSSLAAARALDDALRGLPDDPVRKDALARAGWSFASAVRVRADAVGAVIVETTPTIGETSEEAADRARVGAFLVPGLD